MFRMLRFFQCICILFAFFSFHHQVLGGDVLQHNSATLTLTSSKDLQTEVENAKLAISDLEGAIKEFMAALRLFVGQSLLDVYPGNANSIALTLHSYEVRPKLIHRYKNKLDQTNKILISSYNDIHNALITIRDSTYDVLRNLGDPKSFSKLVGNIDALRNGEDKMAGHAEVATSMALSLMDFIDISTVTVCEGLSADKCKTLTKYLVGDTKYHVSTISQKPGLIYATMDATVAALQIILDRTTINNVNQ